MHRSASLSLGFTASLAWPLAHLPAWAGGHAGLDAGIFYARLRFGFFVFGGFWAAAKSAKHFSVLNLAKIILNNPFCFIRRRRKIYKRCFAFLIGG
ncbi:MAG TPA: hypothetical protein PK009_03050 [bacterium]|nr:hypothetical protein [bacterium]